MIVPSGINGPLGPFDKNNKSVCYFVDTVFNQIIYTILEYDTFSRDETFDCFVTLWLHEHDFRAENPILLFLLESKKNV